MLEKARSATAKGVEFANDVRTVGTIWSYQSKQDVSTRVSIAVIARMWRCARAELPETYTKDSSDDMRAETPEVMMIARARLEPVPPPTGAAIAAEDMSQMTNADRRKAAICQCIYVPSTHFATSEEAQNMTA